MLSRFASFGLASLALTWLGGGASAQAADFFFGSGANGINGLPSANVAGDGATLSLAAAPTGAVLSEISSAGMGVNSRGVAGAVDGSNDKFDVLGGSLAGQTDAITFSFDVEGVLKELYFDGVKDESFEFFTLTTPSGKVLSIFDSQIGLRLVDIASVDEPNVTLLTETGGADDDLFGLAIPFQAGEVFTLTYGEHSPEPNELAPGFTPQAGNGARFEGVVIEIVPEPSAAVLFLVGALSGFAAVANSWCRVSQPSPS